MNRIDEEQVGPPMAEKDVVFAGNLDARRPKGPPKTEGQVLLQKRARRSTEARIARNCGVTQSIVSRWITGKRKPLYENRKVLFELYQIPMDAWDRFAEG